MEWSVVLPGDTTATLISQQEALRLLRDSTFPPDDYTTMEKNYIERVEVSVAEVLLLKKELHMYREITGEVYEPDTKAEEEIEYVLKEL